MSTEHHQFLESEPPELYEAIATTPEDSDPSESKNRYYLASAPMWRSLLHLCVPMIAGLSVGVVYNIINGIFVGTLHSTPLLAALTFSLPVLSLLMAIGGVFGVGGGTYISRLLGSQENNQGEAAQAATDRIKQVSSFAVWGSIVAGAAIGILGLIFATPIASAIGAHGDALHPTAQYIGAMFAFSPAIVAAFTLEQIVRAEGAAMASMTGIIASTVANLALDVLFILVFRWGVLGAGLAVGLTNCVMAAYYVWWLKRKSTVMSLSLRWFRADREMVSTVFGVGASELLMSSFMIVTSLVMNWIAVGYGEALIASVGVAQRIAQLPEMVSMGMYIGAMPLFAYTFGAHQQRRLRQAISSTTLAIAGFTIVFSGTVFLFRGQILGMFSDDPAVLRDGGMVLTAMLVSTIFNGFTGLIITLFQATEQIRHATIMSIAQGVLFVPVILIGNAAWGINGVIWAMTITELLTFALAGVMLVSSRNALESGEAAHQGDSAHPGQSADSDVSVPHDTTTQEAAAEEMSILL